MADKSDEVRSAELHSAERRGVGERSGDIGVELQFVDTGRESHVLFPDFINASPKLRFAIRKVKKRLHGKVLLCQEESFCEGRLIFG